MAIVKKPRDPFESLRKFNYGLQRQMNQMLNRFWDLSDIDFPSFERTGIRRAISNVEDTGKEVVISMELPGVDKKDIKIDVLDNQLEVSVEKKQESMIKKKNYIHEERGYTGFYRSVALPAGTDTSKVLAEYKNGLLKVRLPKKKAKVGKRIKVR